MARTMLPTVVPNSAGVDPAPVAANAAGGHAFILNPHTVLTVITTTNSTNMTVDTPGTLDAGAIPNKVIAIPSGAIRQFKFADFAPLYKQADETVWIDFSTVTGVTLYVTEA